jgi:hypothetical protein
VNLVNRGSRRDTDSEAAWLRSPNDVITKRTGTGNYGTTEFKAETVQIQETNANRIVDSAQQCQTEMNQAIDKQAGAQFAGVNVGAGQLIGGYERGAAEAFWSRSTLSS